MFDLVPAWFLILLFLAGVQPGALPTGLPPLPEDKALVSAAPEECLLYLSWYGRAEAKSTSKNQVEQLLAEPEVQHLYATVWKEFQAAMGRDAFRIGGRAALLSETVLPLAEIVATRPTSLFVSNLQISGRSDMPRNDTQAGLIVNAGQRAKDLQAILARLESLLVEGSGGETKEVTVGGVKMHQLPLPTGTPQVAWGFRSEYLVIAVGEGMAEKIIGRLKDARGPPAWLKRIHERLPIERPAAVTYVNLKGAFDLVSKNLGGGDEGGRKLASILKVTGLDNVESLASVTGLDETELVTQTLLATDGEPRGLLNLVSDKPLTAADLASVPRDATFAVATRWDLAKAYKLAFDMIGEVDPRAAAEIKRLLAEEKELDADSPWFRILKDLLEPLGDVGTLYSSPGEGGMLPGVTAVFSVKQAEKLEKVQASLLRLIRTEGDAEHGPSVESVKFLGQTIYVLDVGRGMPLAPSWCLTDKQLIVGLYPQSIKALLARTPAKGSLADVPAVAAALKERPVALGYQDTPAMFRAFYPFLQALAPMAAHELNRAGMRVDASLLPSAGAIYPHLRPSVQITSRRKNGIVSVSRQTVPAAGGLALAPLVGGLGAYRLFESRAASPPAERATPPAAKEKTERPRKAFDDPAPVAGDKEYTLLVSSTRTGNAEIFLVSPEWGDARNLTRHKAEDTFPAWSPDGKKIAFISNRDGTPNVHVMDADGKRVKQLTTEKGEITYCSCPNWSPDGKKIAFCRMRDGTKVDTVVMDADGSNAKSIRENAWDAAWSPDGKKFACTAATTKGFKLCVMDADGTNLKEFATNDNVLGNVYPCWSPDGKKIAYTDIVDGGQEIHVCDADGTNIRKLSGVGNTNMAAAWSPDGKTIAFQHSDGTGPVSLYLMDADGSNAREVASCKDPSTPVRGNRAAWLPK